MAGVEGWGTRVITAPPSPAESAADRRTTRRAAAFFTENYLGEVDLAALRRHRAKDRALGAKCGPNEIAVIGSKWAPAYS